MINLVHVLEVAAVGTAGVFGRALHVHLKARAAPATPPPLPKAQPTPQSAPAPPAAPMAAVSAPDPHIAAPTEAINPAIATVDEPEPPPQPEPQEGHPRETTDMSILTDLIHGRITFATAASEASQWAQKVVAANPQAQQLAAATLSAVKQGASNMIALADTELAQHYAQVIQAVEAGADAALLGATGGKALPAVPLVNGTIEQIAAAGKAALDVWSLQAKASLAPTNAAAPAPVEHPVA